MACFPHPPLGTPRRRFAVAASLIGNRSADARVRVSRVLAVGGRDKRAMDGARPSQDMDEHGLLARHCRAPVRMPGALRRAGGAAQRRSCRGKSGSRPPRSEEHTSELQSLMRISYAVFCLKKKKQIT